MHGAYLVPRLVRHFMPEQLADWMKKKHLIIQAGLETMEPQAAVDQYLNYFDQAGIELKSKKVMIFGYGGNLLTGCEFLQGGANQIIFFERQGYPLPKFTMSLVNRYPDFFSKASENEIQPNPKYIHIIHEDIRNALLQQKIGKVDLILSASVFEHLDDIDNITHALSSLTAQNGKQVHFVDMRDHFFKYPFEMLTFSEKVWKNFLNPTSNLNRFRIPQYEAVFHKYFSNVKIEITESNIEAFCKIKTKIRKEFLSGNDHIDAATRMIIEADNINK